MSKSITVKRKVCEMFGTTINIECEDDDCVSAKVKILATERVLLNIFDKYMKNEDGEYDKPLYHVYNRPRVLFLQNLLSEYGVPCLVFYVNKKSVIWFDEVKDADHMKKVRKILKICNIGLRKTNFKDSDHKSYHAYECYYIDKEK